MTEGPWRIGIVGCGRIADGWDHPRENGLVITHAQAYDNHPWFELAATVDPDAVRRFQQAWAVPHGLIAEDLCAQDPCR